MAYIFKPRYTRPIPASTTACTHRKRPAVRWVGRGGRVQTALVCETDPSRCLVESATWHISYSGPHGEPLRAKGFADRAATENLMADLVRRSERVASGMLPPEAMRPRLTLADLLDRWGVFVAGGKATAKGAARQLQRARDVCEGVGATAPADLTPAAVRGWLSERKRLDSHKGKRFGAGTAGNYLTAVKSFTRWLALVDRSESVDHLSALRRESDPTDVRRERRALAPVDLERLLTSARASKSIVFGLTGVERHALYLLACSTGLRASELASLTPASFTAEAVVIEASRAKNRRRDELPVGADVMRVVRRLFRGRGVVWPNRGKPSQAWWLRAARMVRLDLAEAGIAAEVGGRVYDFHSLRVQLATDLDRAGVSLSRAQRLMRHSTPTLTARHYTRPEAAELAADVAKLGRGRAER